MKFGYRKPSLKKRVAARASAKRAVRHRLGLKAPRGAGWITNPKRAAYSRVYRRTTFGCFVLVGLLALILAATGFALAGRSDVLSRRGD